MPKSDSKELYRKAWAMALEYVIDKFELPFDFDGKIKTIDLTVGQLGVLQDMMEDFVEPEDRDAFYTTIERFQEGYMAGYRKYEEETLHLSVKNEEDE